MGPVRAPPAAQCSKERQRAHAATGPPDIRALASVVGNRRFARLVQQERSSAAMLQRLAYWAEYDGKRRSRRRSGTDVHKRVLPALGKANPMFPGKANGLFTEVPVPNAKKQFSDLTDTRGFADLYGATTTVGVYFKGDQWPTSLEAGTQTKYKGRSHKKEHARSAAPRVENRADGTPTIKGLANAPAEIVLGDLKGGMDSTEAADGPEQLDNYIAGFRRAAQEVNEYGRRNPTLVEPDSMGARVWQPTMRKFRSKEPAEIKVPDYYTPGKATGQPSVPLVLVGWRGRADMEWSIAHWVRGKLYVVPDPREREGVWIYVWAPDQAVALADLPGHVRDIGIEVAERLRRPLLAPPLARRARQGSPRLAAAPPPLRRPLARQQHAVKDPLNYGQWLSDHRELTARAAAVENNPAVQDATVAAGIEEANAGLRNVGLKAPKVSPAKLAGGRTINEIRLWTGTSGTLIGRFRHLFGAVFTKVAELYLKLKERVGAMLKSSGKTKSFGADIGGAAFKAAYAVLKGVARHVVTKTADRLRTSLAEGTKKKLTSLVGPERVEEVESRLQQITEIVKGLEGGLVERIEDAGRKVIDGYQAILAKIEDVKTIVGKGLDIVNKVRWGARVIACLSPPGIGCLWILAQTVLEAAAARVVDTCWFKRKITPLITKRDWVKTLPARLAESIREKIVTLLPRPLQDIFARIDTSSVAVGEGDIGCDADDDPERDRLTAERRAMWDLIEAVGEERYEALIEAMWQTGARFDRRLTAREIYEAKNIIVKSGVTAKQLRHYAKWYAPFADKRKRGPLGEFLAGLVEMDTDAAPAFGESEGGGDDGHGTDGTARADGAGGTAVEGVPVERAAPRGKPTKWQFVSVSRFGRDLVVGASVIVDYTVKVDGQAVALRRLPMVVIKRRTMPDGGVRVVLSPRKDIVFDLGQSPGGNLPRFITLLETSTVWRTWRGKRPATKPGAAAPRPAPASATAPEPEPEPVSARTG